MAVRVRIALIVFAVGCIAPLNAQDRSQNPLDPRGFPVGKGKDERLPPPLPPESATYELKLISADESTVTEKTVEATHVVFEYRGYRGKCDSLLGDLESQDFAMKGNVNLLGQGSVITGEAVYVNFQSRTFRTMNTEIDIKKTLTEGRLLGDLYLRSALAHGDDARIDSENSSLTTCVLDDPHFQLESESLSYFPGKRIVFRSFRLRVLKKTIFAIPSLTIPLNRSRSSYLPDVGFSEDEGYYMKLRYGFPVGDNSAALLAQFRSKLGYSLGAEYESEAKLSKTFAKLLADFDPAQNRFGMTGSLRLSEKLSFGSLEINHSSRQFSYLAGPQTVAHSTTAEFSPNFLKGGQTKLSFIRNELFNSGFHSLQSALTFADSRKWLDKLSTNVRLAFTDYQASQSGTKLTESRSLDVRFTSIWDEMHYAAQLDYARSVPIGSTENFASGVDRTPELSVRTDSQKLFKSKLPYQFQIAGFAGSYRDNFNNNDITRFAMDMRIASTPKIRNGLVFDYDLGFRQGIYSDNTAQYTPKANLKLAYNWGKDISANLRYNYSKMFGFTPLAVDRQGEYDLSSFDLLAQPLRGLKLGGQVGFDFKRQDQGRVAWTSPSIRAEYESGDAFRMRANAIYDTENQVWSGVRLDFKWKPGGTTVAATAFYDSRRSSWGTINFYLDAFRWGKLSVSLLGTYNGYFKRFDTLHASLIYDLHCNEAVLQIIDNRTGFRPGTEVLFFIRIKALPFATPFGVGRNGQSLGGGFGGIG